MGKAPALVSLPAWCGNKLGSVAKLDVMRVSEIRLLPTCCRTTQVITTDISLDLNATLATYYFDIDTARYQETPRDGDNGTAYNQILEGIIPAGRSAADHAISRLQDGYYVIRITDYNGDQRIIGTLTAPLRFTSRFATGDKRTSSNQYTWRFFGQSRRPACFFTGNILSDPCSALSMDDFQLSPFIFESGTDYFLGVRVDRNTAGLIASIDGSVNGRLYRPDGNLEDNLTYNSTLGYYEPVNGPYVFTPGIWRVEANNIPVTLTGGQSCTADFIQYYTAIGQNFDFNQSDFDPNDFA